MNIWLHGSCGKCFGRLVTKVYSEMNRSQSGMLSLVTKDYVLCSERAHICSESWWEWGMPFLVDRILERGMWNCGWRFSKNIERLEEILSLQACCLACLIQSVRSTKDRSKNLRKSKGSRRYILPFGSYKLFRSGCIVFRGPSDT